MGVGLKNPVDDSREDSSRPRNWGPLLFFATLIVVLVFFWWLLIHSGGASAPHG